jgi:hypothetical protein
MFPHGAVAAATAATAVALGSFPFWATSLRGLEGRGRLAAGDAAAVLLALGFRGEPLALA